MLYSFADRPDAKADLFFDLPQGHQDGSPAPRGEGGRGGLRPGLPPGLREEPPVLRLLHPASGEPPPAEPRRTARGCPGSRSPRPTRRGSTRRARRSSSPSCKAGTTAATSTSAPTACSTSPPATRANPNPPDPFNTGQDISDLLSSILRIDVDHKDEGKNYAVPKDNPFVAMKGARPEVWAYGLRNPWRMSFDRQTGELFVGDVGWELWESVHRVEKGGNYGWSAMEGPQPIKPDQVGPTPIRPAADRAAAHDRVQRHRRAASTAARSSPSCAAPTSSATGRPAGCGRPASRATAPRRCRRSRGRRCASSPSARTGTASCTSSTTTAARCTPSRRNDDGARNADFPTKLSQTGLFASVKDHTPAAGVVPFAVNSRQWQDGATAEHWVAFPGESSATLYAHGQADPRHGGLAQLPPALPQGRGAGADPLAGRPAAGDAAPALRRRGLARLHLRLAGRPGGRRPGPRRRRREGGERRQAEARLAVPEPQPVHVVPQQPVGVCAGVPARAVEPAGAGRAQPARRAHRGGTDPPGRADDGKPLPPFDAASAAKRTQARRPRGRAASLWRPGPAPTCTPTAGTATRRRRRVGRRCGCSSRSRSRR